MSLIAEASTSPSLLKDVSDWHNHPAWVSFRGVYDPHLRRWCQGYGLDDDSIEEVCQLIWIELAQRMKTFCYDPNGSFRGWLRRLCDCRVRDFLRRRKVVGLLSLNGRDDSVEAGESTSVIDFAETEHGDSGDPHRDVLLEEAEKVQAAVRARVKTQTWDAFWLVSIQDWTVEQTANALGMTRTAVYATRERVARMLCDEGRRVMDRWLPST
jgi:RNA polymerase sigma factor (sigma-70 family)